jgi:hypothetical protein
VAQLCDVRKRQGSRGTFCSVFLFYAVGSGGTLAARFHGSGSSMRLMGTVSTEGFKLFKQRRTASVPILVCLNRRVPPGRLRVQARCSAWNGSRVDAMAVDAGKDFSLRVADMRKLSIALIRAGWWNSNPTCNWSTPAGLSDRRSDNLTRFDASPRINARWKLRR